MIKFDLARLKVFSLLHVLMTWIRTVLKAKRFEHERAILEEIKSEKRGRVSAVVFLTVHFVFKDLVNSWRALMVFLVFCATSQYT